MGKSKTAAAGARQFQPSRLPAMRESDLEIYGTDLLALDGWRALKTDPVSRREWGKGFGETGMADHQYIRYGMEGAHIEETLADRCWAQILWIEWKRIRPGRRKAEQAAAHQRAWIRNERFRGAVVLLAGADFEATPEGFLAFYRKSGLMRRPIL